jgi:hypothetical protein
MKTKLLILLIAFAASDVCAQFIRQNDTVFFGPGLQIVDKKWMFDRSWDDYNGRYWRYLNGLFMEDMNLYVRYRYGYGRTDFYEEIRENFGIYGYYDSFEVISERNGYLGEIPCKLIDLKCRKYNPFRARHSLFKHHNYVIQVDTTIHDFIDVCAFQMFKRRITRRKFLRKFATLKVVDIEDFPPNLLVVSSRADSLEEDQIRLGSEFTEVGILQCMTANDLQSEYPHYYLPEMDSLMENFEYEKVRSLLRKQFEHRCRLDWEEYKSRIQLEFTKYGDASVQKEYEIRKRMYEGKIGLDDFMNYSTVNGQASVFDTLCRIHLRQCEFRGTIEYPVYSIYFGNASFSGISEGRNSIHYPKLFNESEVRLVIENDLENYIYRKYLEGKSLRPQCKLLLEIPKKRLYAYKNDSSPDEFWNMVTVSEKTPGHWKAQVHKLNPEIDPLRLNEAIYFNGLTTFVNGEDFIVMDSTDGGFGYHWIDAFPDKSKEFNCGVFVKGNAEIFATQYRDINFYNPVAYNVAGVSELLRESWKEAGTNNTNERNYILRSLDPSEVIYYGQDISDLDHDGVFEMFSFGISNGKLIYAQCYTVVKGKFIKLSDEEALRVLTGNSLFENLLKYSTLQ